MSGSDPAAQLKALLAGAEPDERLARPPGSPEGTDPALSQLVYSFLLWEAGPRHAEASLKRILTETVDYNELRVCTHDELRALLTSRHPRAHERCERLRSTLHDIYQREHRLALDWIAEWPKRDARQYLEALEGMPQFVAARVTLLTLGAHRFPVDSRIVGLLQREGLYADRGNEAAVASDLERLVRAGEAAEAYLAIESLAAAGRRDRRPPRETGAASTPQTRDAPSHSQHGSGGS